MRGFFQGIGALPGLEPDARLELAGKPGFLIAVVPADCASFRNV